VDTEVYRWQDSSSNVTSAMSAMGDIHTCRLRCWVQRWDRRDSPQGKRNHCRCI